MNVEIVVLHEAILHVWTGSIFNCTSGEIALRHRLFGDDSNSTASGECNDGAVIAHSVGVVSTNNTDCYISQLNVMSTTYFTEFGIKNKTVTCLHFSGIQMKQLFRVCLPL